MDSPSLLVFANSYIVMTSVKSSGISFTEEGMKVTIPEQLHVNGSVQRQNTVPWCITTSSYNESIFRSVLCDSFWPHQCSCYISANIGTDSVWIALDYISSLY